MNTKLTLLIVGLCLALVGCEEPAQEPAAPACPDCPYQVVKASELPTMNLPYEARQKNWIRYGSGSCYYASTVSVLRWQGRDDIAENIRRKCGGGAYTSDVARALDAEGLQYAFTTSGDVGFLEWCIRTRRGAAIAYFDSHAITLVHLDAQEAWVLDNNRTERYIRIPRQTFIHRWINVYGGDAITVVGTPAAPLLQL